MTDMTTGKSRYEFQCVRTHAHNWQLMFALVDSCTWFVLVFEGRGLDTIGPKMSKSSLIGAALLVPAPLLTELAVGASE